MRVLTTTCFGLTCGTSSGCKIRLDKLYYNAWENIIWSRGVLRGTMVPFYICLVLLRSLPAVVCLSGMSKPRQGGGPGHNGMKRMQQDRSTSSLKYKDSRRTVTTLTVSSGRVIGPSQRPVPGNTTLTTDIHGPGGIRTRSPSKRAAACHSLACTATGIACVVYTKTQISVTCLLETTMQATCFDPYEAFLRLYTTV